MTPQQKLYIRLIKRPIGFLGALVALILLSPLFIATMVLLFFANKGSLSPCPPLKGRESDSSPSGGVRGGQHWWNYVFFTQDRPGKGEKIFKALKFKTMTDERDSEGNLLPDADRLTKVGKFVRATSIDELPQLINILKGDMAFIGPPPAAGAVPPPLQRGAAPPPRCHPRNERLGTSQRPQQHQLQADFVKF